MHRKTELLFKVITWRIFSMCYGFFIAYLFTGNAGESAGIVFLTGSSLTLLQWFFEIIWDKQVRHRIRHALSGKYCGIGRLVWVRRSSRTVCMDEHESRSDRCKEESNPLSPKNAGREWT